jgi:hypothetical protein
MMANQSQSISGDRTHAAEAAPEGLADPPANPTDARHTGWVKSLHWIVTVSFLTLAFTGVVILMAHPRLYWGETGNDLTPALWEMT